MLSTSSKSHTCKHTRLQTTLKRNLRIPAVNLINSTIAQLPGKHINSPPSASREPTMCIHVVRDPPRCDLPLLMGAVSKITRAAFAVTYKDRRYLLTTASNVLYSTQITVSMHGRNKPFKARVEHLCVEADFALLCLSDGDASVLEEMVEPMVLQTQLPCLQDQLHVLLPPSNSVDEEVDTQGLPTPALVSCIEMTIYNCAKHKLMAMQLACSTSKQQLGAPVVSMDEGKRRCVGMVFQRVKGKKLKGGQNGTGDAALAVPASLIAHVLDDIIRTGKHQGFPQLGIKYKELHAPALRSHMQIGGHKQGVLVSAVNPTSSAAGVLQAGDVLLAVTGPDGCQHMVSRDGSVHFRDRERVSMTHVLGSMAVGDAVSLDIVRSGREQTLQLKIGEPGALVATNLRGLPPSYLIIGGMVLTPLTLPYLEQSFGKRRWPKAAPISHLRLISQFPGGFSSNDKNHSNSDGPLSSVISEREELCPPSAPQQHFSQQQSYQADVVGDHDQQTRMLEQQHNYRQHRQQLEQQQCQQRRRGHLEQQQQWEQQWHVWSKQFGPQQPVVVAHCEDTASLEGYEPQSLQHSLVTGFGVIPRQGVARQSGAQWSKRRVDGAEGGRVHLGAGGGEKQQKQRAEVQGLVLHAQQQQHVKQEQQQEKEEVQVQGVGVQGQQQVELLRQRPEQQQGTQQHAMEGLHTDNNRPSRPELHAVHNLKHLASAVLACQRDGEVWLELDSGETGLVVVLDQAQAAADMLGILQDYEVDQPVSKDLLDCLPQKSNKRAIRQKK